MGHGYSLVNRHDMVKPDPPTPPQSDMVNHPPHYTDGGIETADFIEAKQLNWHRGNAIKYISRAGKKGPPEQEAEDIQKAIWYLERDLKRRDGISAKQLMEGGR